MGLYVQRDALNIAQKALDITGNNIANIHTEGYSRQRVDVCSVAHSNGTLGYNNAIELAGRGAQAVGITQIRSKVYDRQVRTFSSNLCEVGAKLTSLSDLEDIFDSIESDTRDTDGKDLGVSFASLVSKLKSALSSFSTDNADRSVLANNVLNEATSLIQSINKYAIDIDKISNRTLTDTSTTVDRINQIFEQMGTLNKQIKDAYVSMGYITSDYNNYRVQNQYGPLELKDKMNTLLDELSQYGNIEYNEENDGTFTVKFADNIVVKEKYYAQMAMSEFNPRPTELGFIISSNENHFTAKKDAAGNVIDAFGYVNTEIDYRIRGLKDKDEWYKLHLDNGTGGDTQTLLRSGAAGKTLNITGGRNGKAIPQYLESGSLRGILDVYNGRGDTFADKAEAGYENVSKQVEVANKALADLAAYNQDPSKFTLGEVNKLKDTIDKALGAKIVENDDGTFTVSLGNTELLSADGTVKTLSVSTKAGQDYASVIASGQTQKTDANGNLLYTDADGNETTDATAADGTANTPVMEDSDTVIRQIYSNKEKGIEYYRDLLNSFVKTFADEFNSVYKGFDVKVDTAEYVNSYAMQLAEYNKVMSDSDPDTDSELTRDDIAKIIEKLKKVDGVTVTPDTANGGETYTVTYKGDVVTAADGTITKIDPDTLSEDDRTTILKDVDYELITFDTDSFRTAALDVRIGEDWLNRPEIISDPTNNNDFEELQNAQINKLLGIFDTKQTYWDAYGHSVKTEHTIEGFVDFLCSDLGSKISEQESLYETTDISLTLAETERSEIMDVEMDEEGVNMMNYQKWYSAISRMISTMDELLDKLINNTGVVGLR